MELTGLYALRTEEPRGFASRKSPLMSRASACSSLEALVGKKRIRLLSTFIEHAAEGSRSPMETRQWLLAFLPKRYGGYGLPHAHMNATIELSSLEQRETGRNHIECDLYWPYQDVVIEYDGAADHSSYDDRARDATKRNVLQTRGIRVFTITARQILDMGAFNAVIRNVADALHYRLRAFPSDWEKRHRALREGLFVSMRQ